MATGKTHVHAVRNSPTLRRKPATASRLVRSHQRQGPAFSAPAVLQPALKVGAANDPLEREAESMAERVVAMPSPRMAQADATADGATPPPDARRDAIDNQPSTEELETVPPIPEDHQDPEVPPQEDVAAEDLSLDDMREIETGEPVDTAGEPPPEETPVPPGEEDTAMPARDSAVVGAEGGAAPPDVAHRVAQPGSGRPLPGPVRAFMEPRFGRDFSGVRIHDAPEDRRAAQRIGARAFTHRDHIWIGPGESAGDRKLLAHELTHVVQQTSPQPAAPVTRAAAEPTEEDGEPEVRRGYLRNKAEKYARNVPGYRLICVIIGRSPITGDRVERNAINLLGAMMSLIPGGNLLFERLQEARIIEEAFEWVSSRLSALNITWTRIKGLISDLLDYLPDWPSDVVAYARKLFKPMVEDILTFIGDVTIKILEFIVRGALRLAGPWAEKIWEIIQQAGAVIGKILKDPLGFAKNLFAVVVRGFKQFGKNIWTHIKKGLLGWLFGTIRGLDIELPERLDFKGLISIGLQIVGLTYANFRKLLVKRLDPNGERKVAFIEKSVDAVKILVKEGFVGLWQRVLQMVDNFKETVIGGIQKFVIETLIMGGISWLAGLSNPVGAVVKVVLAIYNIIKTFLERLDQILDVAKSIFSSIGAIAAGRIQDAADFVERTMAATIPVVISFLAALVPVTGITNAIRGIIAKLRGAVERALDRMITFVVKKGKKLFSKLIGRLNRKRELPSANFTIGETQHRIYADKKGKKLDVFVRSEEQTTDDALSCLKSEVPKFKEASPETLKEIMEFINTFEAEETDAEKKAGKVDLDSQKKPALKSIEDLKAELEQGSERLTQFGLKLADNGDVLTTDPTCLVRFRKSTYEHEGLANSYTELAKLMDGAKKDGVPASDLYERDHVPGVTPLNLIKDLSEELNSGAGGKPSPVRAGEPQPVNAQKARAAPPLGAFHTRGLSGRAATFKAIVVDKKFNVRGADAQANDDFRNAAKAATPEARKSAAEAAIGKHVDSRVAQLTEAYSKHPDETTRNRVRDGLGKIKELAKADFGLPATFETAAPAIPAPGPGEARSMSIPFEDPEKKDLRNFAEGEGRSGNYKVTTNKFTNEYLEFDHVMDSSFVEAARAIRVNSIWEPAKKAIEEAAGTDAKARKRKNTVSSTKLFGGGKLESYSHNTSLAVGIFTRVNHQVATQAGTFTQPAATAEISKEIKATDLDDVVDYVKSGTGGPTGAAAKARDKVEAALDKRFEAHRGVIETGYEGEKREVAALNAASPAQQAASEAQMRLITARLRLSLQAMRTEKNDLLG